MVGLRVYHRCNANSHDRGWKRSKKVCIVFNAALLWGELRAVLVIVDINEIKVTLRFKKVFLLGAYYSLHDIVIGENVNLSQQLKISRHFSALTNSLFVISCL